MIDVKNISKRYGNIVAVDDVSLQVESGSIVGLLGPNGAGKTSLIRVLTGFHHPNEGRAFVDSVDVVKDSVEARKRIGYVPESLPLYPDLSVFEYLTFIANARSLDRNTERIEEALSHCGLSEMKYRRIGDLSKGYRQRVGLAQATVHDPAVLILDEPTSGLDPLQLIDIRGYIKELGKTKTVILSTHIMQEVEALCEKALIMNQGKIVASGSMNDLRTYGGAAYQYSIEFLGTLTKDGFSRLRALPNVLEVVDHGAEKKRHKVEVRSGKDLEASIFDFTCEENLKLLGLTPHKSSVEDVFVKLTGGTNDQITDSEGS